MIVEEELLAAGPGDATVRVTWSYDDVNNTNSNTNTIRITDIYQSIVELANSAGTILLTRFQGCDQLLLTFASP